MVLVHDTSSHYALQVYEVSTNSRVTFKAQLKVGWQPKYNIECYIPKC